MATEIVTFEGTISWAKVYEPETAFGATKWKLNFFPADDAEWDKFNKAGIRKRVKENNNPDNNVPIGKFFEVSRDAFKMIKGKLVNFTGPIVTNSEGHVIVDYINRDTNRRIYSYSNEEKDKVVRRGAPITLGNGTKVKLSVAVYDTNNGKGQRLESIQVLDLVEFEAGGGELPPVVNDVRQALAPVDRPQVNNQMNDDIPF